MQTPPNAMSAALHSAFRILYPQRCFVSALCNAAARVLIVTLIDVSVPPPVAAASEYVGQVIFGRLAVPGATVTAVRGDEQHTTSTDVQGIFRFADIADGTWSITIEMRGFAALTREVT